MYSVEHPLSQLNTLEDLLTLPYFDFISCLGLFSMHPGGINQTINLFEQSGCAEKEKILEIGCGNGLTTQLLLESNFDVHIVEPCQYLLQTTLNLSLKDCKKTPPFYFTNAENLDGVPKKYFDKVLMEAVFGFIENKPAAIKQIQSVLNYKEPLLCVNDFYYHEIPPKEVLNNFQSATQTQLELLTKDRWLSYLNEFKVCLWDDFEIPTINSPNPIQVKQIVEDNNLLELIPDKSTNAFEKISERWKYFNSIFDENKKYLTGFSATFSPSKC